MNALEFTIALLLAGAVLWLALYCGEEIKREMRGEDE